MPLGFCSARVGGSLTVHSLLRIVGRLLKGVLAGVAGLLVLWAFVDLGVRSLDRSRELGTRTPIRILFWGDNRERAIVDELVAAFEEANPDIDVQPLHAGDYDGKLKTMLAAGDPPDCFYVPYERMLGELVESGQLLDLEPYVARERAQNPGWFEDFYPKLVDAFRWDTTTKRQGSGPLYGLPKDFTTTVKYVNVDLFEAAGVPVPSSGWTWDEYADAVRRIADLKTNADGRPVYGGVILTWNWALRSIVWTFGGDYFADSFDRLTLDHPGVLAAYQFILDRRFKDKTVYNATGIAQSEDELFRLGQVGVIGPLGRWRVPTLRQVDFRWDVVPMPTAPGVEPVAPIATVAWGISAGTANPDAAWRVVKFLCDRRGQELTAELGLAIPAMRSIAESPTFHRDGDKPANTRAFFDALDHAKLIISPTSNEYQIYIDEEVMNRCLRLNELTPAQAAENAQDRWETFLASPLNRADLPRMNWPLATGVAVAALGLATGIGLLVLRRQRLARLDAAEERAGWAFVAPWVVGFLAFTLGPMVLSLILSLTKWSATVPLSMAQWVGPSNYTTILAEDVSFRRSVGTTLYYTLLAVPLSQIAALAVALLMNMAVRGIGLIRTIYFLPSVVAGVALVTLWVTIFDGTNGLLNGVLRPVLEPLGITPPDWFGADSRWWASPALVIMGLWGVGGGMVIYLAGLKGVPRSLYEAAAIDGAGPSRRFWSVTVPMISPIIFFQLIMAIIGSFQVFTQAFIMRGASGNNQDLLFYVVNLYEQAFRLHNMGYASALAWLLFAAILILTLIVFRGSRGLVHYEGLKS